jgi:hypothetical protein
MIMIKQTLILSLLPVAVGAHARCASDPPEIGDIGPSSELVCAALEHQFPDASLKVVGRSIHSPTEVSVAASVDGRPIAVRYELSGYTWRLDRHGARIAVAPTSGADVPTHQ